MIDTKEEADARVEKILDERYEESNNLLKRMEAFSATQQDQQNTEALKE